MSEWLDEPVVLELTEEQRSRMLEDTGISMSTITATRASLIGMAIAADAAATAVRRRPGAKVRLDLTDDQRQRLLRGLRTPVARLLLRWRVTSDTTRAGRGISPRSLSETVSG